MRILIDAHLSSDQADGIGRYLNELIPALLKIDQRNEYVVLLKSGISSDHPLRSLEAPNLQKQTVPWSGLDWKEHLMLPRLIKETGVDIYHHPHFDAPWVVNIPTVVTIHGMKYIRYPGLYRTQGGRHRVFFKRLYMKTMMGHSVRKAHQVIAVSKSVRDEIISVFHVSQDRISVVYLGVRTKPVRPTRSSGIRAPDSRYGIKKRYILSVSEQLPHKNLIRLIEAFAIFREKHGNEYQLIIAGRAHSDYSEPHRKVRELSLSDVVVFTGHLPDDQLGPIYESATMLVFLSLYEGFGLPVLEAMAQGTPVIASNQASLPEIVGDAGVLVDPRYPQNIAAAMEEVISDPRRSEKLREKGLERVKDFTWERTARATADIYRDLYHRCLATIE